MEEGVGTGGPDLQGLIGHGVDMFGHDAYVDDRLWCI